MAEDVPVLIVGGGPVGLSASVLLSRLGVPSLLIERHPDTTIHPKARNINTRSAEILRPWGIEAELLKGSLPASWSRQFVYTRTLAGDEVGRMRTAGFRSGRAFLSPAMPLLSSQDLIEPVLRSHAESYAGASVRFSHELIDLAIDDGVRASIHDRTNDKHVEVRARYLLAADGAASFVRGRLGIPLEGPQGIGSFINVYFRADLSRWTDGRPAVLYWISEPGTAGVFQPLDGDRRWLCQIAYDADAESLEDWPAERCEQWIRRAAGSDEPRLDILSIGSWTMNAAVAASFRGGPVFLIGDAAHQLPPTGGFGMNTGIQDAHNLAWKLAAVLQGWAGPQLLDTFESERLPVARYNTERSLENARMVGRVNAEALTGGRPGAAVSASRRYGNFLGMDLGFSYGEGAVVPDGTNPPVVEDEVVDYVPTARPGHRAPHVVLKRGAVELSTLDLFENRFTLLAGADGAAWREAAVTVSRELRVPLHAYVVGPAGELIERAEDWRQSYGVDPGGAVLVRPDGHVGWRSKGPAGDPEWVLGDALKRLLFL